MSGGAGSRLWPLSRQAEPKQLLPLVTKKTMLQETVARFDDPLFSSPVFICNQLHVDAIQTQMSGEGVDIDAIIVEPIGRNTAPCAIAAACHAAQKPDAQTDDLIILVPADHHVKNPSAFLAAVKDAMPAAKDGYLVTFGIQPNSPETGYGYVAQGKALYGHVSKVAAFKEKPDKETAQAYLNAGSYMWNAGIFLFSPTALLNEAHTYADSIHEHTQRAYKSARKDGSIIP